MAATFAEYLHGLNDEALASLLTLRRDVCAEPLPADFSRLADRLCTSASLVKVLGHADRDAMEVARAVVVLGAGPTAGRSPSSSTRSSTSSTAPWTGSSSSAWPGRTRSGCDCPTAWSNTSPPTSVP